MYCKLKYLMCTFILLGNFVLMNESKACCTGGADIILSNTTISQAVSNNILAPGVTNQPGLCIFISGSLIIDQNYLFSGIEFRLDEDAMIIVQPGRSLSLWLSNLEGCTYLWREIRVRENAHLSLRACKISDAFYGINALTSANINVISTTFDNNYVGIYTNAELLGTHRIEGCFFLNTDGNLKDEGLNDPPPTDYSQYGIWTDGVFLFNLGYPNFNDYLEVTPVNVFDGIHTGVYAQNTRISVNGCQFKNLKTGILFEDGSILIQTGLGAVPPSPPPGAVVTPSFLNVQTCIDGRQINQLVNIEHNLMTSETPFSYLKYGIKLDELGIVSNVNISKNNIIEPSVSPIMIQDSDAFGNLIIENNYIQQEVNSSAGIAFGIQVDVDQPFTLPTNSFIQNNEIRLYTNITNFDLDDNIAISITNNGPNVVNNDIAFLGPSDGVLENDGIGIQVHGSGTFAAPIIACNHIESEFVGSADNTGIRVLSVSFSLVNCNSVEDTRYGITFSGVCSNTEFSANSFKNHDIGFLLDQSIMGFGNQAHRGNIWSGTYNSNGARYEGDLFNLPLYQFEIDFNDFMLNPELMPPSLFPAIGWFGFANGTTQTCQNVCNTGIQWLITPSDEAIAIGTLEPSIYKEEQKWLAAKRLYRKIEDHNLLGLNTKVDSFYNSNISTNIGGFVSIQKSIESALQPVSSIQNQMQTNRQQIVFLMDTISMIDKNLVTSTGQDSLNMISEKLVFMNKINGLAFEQDSLQLIVINDRKNALDLIIPANASVSALTTQENNIKTYNSIRLNYLYKEDYNLSVSQLNEIYTIANQCPFSGGDIVYAARAVYNSLIDSTLQFDDTALCTQQSNFTSSNSSSVLNEEKFIVDDQSKFDGNIIVYPNPADQSANLIISQSQFNTGEMILFDMYGKLILNIHLSDGQQKYTFDTSFLPNGVYLYKVFLNGHEEFSDKISIIRN